MNKQKLYEELTDAFITYQHNLENPFPSRTETRASLILKYKNDYLFKNKVDSLVSGVMYIVDRCINEK